MTERIREQLGLALANVTTAQDAEAIVAEFEAGAQGRIASPFLEALLLAHPRYRAQPHREFLDGYVREYTSDGSGKARGIKLALQYPVTWQANAGRRPHVLQILQSNQGNGWALLIVLILEAPPEIEELGPSFDISKLANQALLKGIYLQAASEPGTQMGRYGNIAVGERTWAWIEAAKTEPTGETKLETRSVWFVTLHSDAVVMVLTEVGCAGPDEEKRRREVEERMLRYGPLFRLMIQSVDFFDRYD